MAFGPVLIFDKSTLQSLTVDEAVWLDNFFLCNITPLFFVETLADLEKNVRGGKTPEEVVGSLANKTPDVSSRPNAHHKTLLAVELMGLDSIDMRFGRPIITGGEIVTLEGNTGTIFRQAPEQEAFQRWQQHEFLQVERAQAKSWRRELMFTDYDGIFAGFEAAFEVTKKPNELTETRLLADAIIDRIECESMFCWGLALLGVLQPFRDQVVARWKKAGSPHVREFAPYFAYVLTVDVFFYLATVADLISRDRRSNRADIAYLYYLPFCNVFTSNDNLHVRTVPLFLRDQQVFVNGANLKADLGRLDDHYSAFAEEVKSRGLFSFALYPPTDSSFLVTRLWDKFMAPEWRQSALNPQQQRNTTDDGDLLRFIKRFKEDAVPVDLERSKSACGNMMMLEQIAYSKKGKWIRFQDNSSGAHGRAENRH